MTKPSRKARRFLTRRRTSKSGTVSSVTFERVPLELSRHIRGLYGRVAHRLGVDTSYVSRVARGEDKSGIVEDALRDELIRVAAHVTKKRNRLGREASGKRAKS
jgi:hypothetical protein